MYGAGSVYLTIPMALVIGLGVPPIIYALHRIRPTWGFDKVIAPIIFWYLGYLSVGVNSSIFFAILAGAISQMYIRKVSSIPAIPLGQKCRASVASGS